MGHCGDHPSVLYSVLARHMFPRTAYALTI